MIKQADVPLIDEECTALRCTLGIPVGIPAAPWFRVWRAAEAEGCCSPRLRAPPRRSDHDPPEAALALAVLTSAALAAAAAAAGEKSGMATLPSTLMRRRLLCALLRPGPAHPVMLPCSASADFTPDNCRTKSMLLTAITRRFTFSFVVSALRNA